MTTPGWSFGQGRTSAAVTRVEGRTARAPGASAALAHLQEMLPNASDARPAHRAELFLRATSTARAARVLAEPGEIVQSGVEEGTALRLASTSGHWSFAAASGCSPDVVRWLRDHAARSGEHAPLAGGKPWAGACDGPILDTESDVEAGTAEPDTERLREWLDRSTRVLRSAAAGAGARLVDLRIEAARVTEALATSDGLGAARCGVRVWALATLEHDDGTVRRQSRLARAARTLAELDPEGWKAWIPPRPSTPAVATPTGPLVFPPQQAAVIVRTLVSALHGPGDRAPLPVGPGWWLEDDPDDPRSLARCRFDDAGFPTRRTSLADGARTTGRLIGPGHLRRASFRDPPSPLPFQLRLQPVASDPPRHGFLVGEVRLHMSEGTLLIDLGGYAVVSGRPRRPWQRRFLRVLPPELVKACRASFGPSLRTHRGVETASLVFEGLETSPS